MSTSTVNTGRQKYLCRLKPNPAKVYSGIVGGVTFCQFLEELEMEKYTDGRTSEVRERHTGRRWLKEPVFEYDEATVEAFQKRLPFAVLRPGSGVVKLDSNWHPVDPVTREPGKRYTVPPSEGDVLLADYLEFRPWTGSTEDEMAKLRAANEALKKELDELKRAAEEDDAKLEEEKLRVEAPVDREPGPRNKRRRRTSPGA